MARRSIVSHCLLATSLLFVCSVGSAQASGVIRFSGMIVEPPCSLSMSDNASSQARFNMTCPRPAAGSVAFMNTSSQTPLRTFRLTQQSQSVRLPAIDTTKSPRIIAVVTYL
ncbi:hypothetical protein BCh11DRAFT_05512 [Burkholderia sp. Ch1-1]|uniref:Type 1 fimbrial protein n=1 Tax=Paraburkholderia dioscoreae TaxID=2604047 RepID=A0A5Q4ZFV2_9BURK|nr:hypothetical protein BCh11DRAFT_05512 [Burkholderia sp. Ch1-1]VVD29904.1 conserved exported protein of unknown function [Paraburkholderia dioscoreae]